MSYFSFVIDTRTISHIFGENETKTSQDGARGRIKQKKKLSRYYLTFTEHRRSITTANYPSNTINIYACSQIIDWNGKHNP